MTQVDDAYVRGADTPDDLRERARRLLSQGVFDHVVGAAGDERTLAANRAGFGRYRLRPRVLTDVSTVDLSVEVLGTSFGAPIFTCPTGGIGLVHPDGERGVARAAKAAGVGFVLSGSAGITIEEGAAVAGDARWYQIYWQGYREVMADLGERAKSAGYRAIVLTVDNATDPRRPRVIRSGFEFPQGINASNFLPYAAPEWSGAVSFDKRGRPIKGKTDDVLLTWANIEWLRSVVDLPLVLKGVRHPEDATRAIDAGVDGIIISNHGGRSLDGEPGTIEVLEEVVEAVAGRMAVLLDGGVRRATDVATALALGADAVGIGSPVVWALATGEETVTEFLEDMVEDLERTFGMLGVSRVSELSRAHVSRHDQFVSDEGIQPYLPPPNA